MPHEVELDLLNVDPSHGTDIGDFSKPVKLYPVRRLQILHKNMSMIVAVPLTLLFLSTAFTSLVRIFGVFSGHPESNSHLPLDAEDIAQILRERKSFAFSQIHCPPINKIFLIDRRSV